MAYLINACSGCEVIHCMLDPWATEAREKGNTGGFICRMCRTWQRWGQSIADGSSTEGYDAWAEGDRLFGISGMRMVECPFGLKFKARLAVCVECYGKYLDRKAEEINGRRKNAGRIRPKNREDPS